MTIEEQKASLAQQIRDVCTASVELWKLVPDLALEANGRTGYLDKYARAYHHGYWSTYTENGYFQVYVDLDTGELVSAVKVENLAPDWMVLKTGLNESSAAQIVHDLREGALAKTCKIYNAQEIAQWRKQTRLDLGLKERYERGAPRKNLPFVFD